jgi:uncharacterized membrane protein YjgN (DUF898 family)
MNTLASLGIRLSMGVAAIFALLVLLTPAPAFAEPDICGNAGNVNSQSDPKSSCNKFIDKYVNPAILALTGLVGIVAIISFIMAGIQYASSADDPGMVTKAKQRMFNTVLGLVAYLFLFAFLNYLIPGGLF